MILTEFAPFTPDTYAIDPATGALTQKASAPLPDSMPYVSTDRTGFTASYGDDKLAVSPISEDGLVEAEAIQVIPPAEMRIRSCPIAATNSCTRPRSAPTRCCNSPSTARPASSRPTTRQRSSPEAGHGPRHMAFSPDNKNLYVLNELSGHVTQYAIDSSKGTLTLVESISSVPADVGLAAVFSDYPSPVVRN